MSIRILTLLSVLFLSGCVSTSEVSPEELQRIEAADLAVSGVLFDAEVDAATSYNVHRDGFVVIRFAAEVEPRVYREVVAQLRADARITGVRAEQGGREVCILKQSR